MHSRKLTARLLVATFAAAALPLIAAPSATAAEAATRPTEDIYTAPEATPVCRADICVHYAQDGTNDVPTEDDGAGGAWKGYADNGVPDFVDLVSASFLPKAATVLTDAGYRAPVGDGATGGGTDQVDIYLADLADAVDGAFCTREGTPGVNAPAPGFCVLDNDYAAAEYGTRLSPAANLSLDVAHHYGTLVQFAYPAWWLWQDTFGTWLEDEIYPNLNRNRALLAFSPLAHPANSMWGMYGNSMLEDQGRWIFLRFLGERFPAEVGSLPVVVRDVLERGDDALVSRGSSLLREFTTFTGWNRDPAAFYDEGASYPTAPLAGNVMLNGTSARTKTFRGRTEQWVSKSYRFRPSPSLAGAWRLRIDASSESVIQPSGKALVATFKPKSGPAVTRVVDIDEGERIEAALTFTFTTKVDWVEVRAVTGEAGVGSNPSETGEPTVEIRARVLRG